MTTVGVGTPLAIPSIYVGIVGLGIGATMPVTVVAAQNGVGVEHLGSVTSITQFTRKIGSTLGVAVLGAFFTAHVAGALDDAAAALPPGADPDSLLETPSAINALPADLAAIVRGAVADGVTAAFMLAFIVALASVAVSLLPAGRRARRRRAGRRRHVGGSGAVTSHVDGPPPFRTFDRTGVNDMKHGYRILDTDTHVGPNMETFEQYASAELRDRWSELLPYFMQISEGHHLSVDPIQYKRGDERERRPRAAVRGRPAGRAAGQDDPAVDRSAATRGEQPQRAGSPAGHGHRRGRRPPDHPGDLVDRGGRARLVARQGVVRRVPPLSGRLLRARSDAVEGGDHGPGERSGMGGGADP